MLPAQPNQSLIDGLECLGALATAGEPVGSREMARMLNLEPTRANRLLKTLAALGIAQQTAARRYVPGPGMHVLSAQAMHGSGLLRAAVPVLEKLRKYQLNVALGVLWQARVCYLYFASPKTPLADALGGRGLFAAEDSGIGLPLLASLEKAQLATLYAPAEPHRRKSLLKKVGAVRTSGYAYLPADDKRTEPVVGVAVGNPAVAGLALSGAFPESRVGELVDVLRKASKDIVRQSQVVSQKQM